MSRIMLWLGWGSALALAVLCGVLYQHNAGQNVRSEKLEQDLALQQEANAELALALTASEATREAQELEKEALQEAFTAVENDLIDPHAETAERPSGANPFSVFKEFFDDMPDMDEEEAGLLEDAFEEFLSDEENEDYSVMHAALMMDMYYSDYFEDADLPDEVEASLRTLLSDYHQGELELPDKLLDGEWEMDDVDAMMDSMSSREEQLHADLKKLLGKDEYELWAAYNDEKEMRMIANNFAMGMEYMAPMVTRNSRKVFVNAVVDELFALEKPEEEFFFPDLTEMSEGFYDNVRDRLAETLDEQQCDYIDQFIIQQQQEMAELMREIEDED